MRCQWIWVPEFVALCGTASASPHLNLAPDFAARSSALKIAATCEATLETLWTQVLDYTIDS